VSHLKQELRTLREHPSSTSVISGVRVARFVVFCVMFCRSSFVHLSFILLTIMLSVLLPFTVSDYPFGIFKLSLYPIFVSVFLLWYLILLPSSSVYYHEYFLIIYIALSTSLLLLFSSFSLRLLASKILIQTRGWVSINQFNPATFLCISQARTWIPNAMRGGVFYSNYA